MLVVTSDVLVTTMSVVDSAGGVAVKLTVAHVVVTLVVVLLSNGLNSTAQIIQHIAQTSSSYLLRHVFHIFVFS